MTNSEANIILIKEALHSIAKQISPAPKAKPSNDLKTSAAKLYNQVILNNNPTERFYFIYLICQVCASEKSNKVDKLLKIVLPSQPNQESMELVSDLISFAICHPSTYACVLDNMSIYLDYENEVHIDIESWIQAESLALDSPTFCSALLNRRDLLAMGIGYRLLAKWLNDLSKTNQEFPPVNLSEIIRGMFMPIQDETDKTITSSEQLQLSRSDLHLGILTVIQSRRCQTLGGQFLIDLAKHLSGLSTTTIDKEILIVNIDRFAQILSVAIAGKVANITNALRTGLEPLQSNQLIAAVMRWPNKYSG